jgi:xylan 1,4-beta-xylosidase
MGPWSEPIFLNASGFDPSLFYDEDGRKWRVNMVWDHRPGEKSISRHCATGIRPRNRLAVWGAKDHTVMIWTGVF